MRFGGKNTVFYKISGIDRCLTSCHHIFLIGTIKPCNICYWHFLLRSFLSEVFNDPFHKTKNKQDCSTQEDCCRESERVDKEWTRQHTVICRASVHPSLKPLANLWLLYFNWPKLAKARTSLHCQFLSDSLSWCIGTKVMDIARSGSEYGIADSSSVWFCTSLKMH